MVIALHILNNLIELFKTNRQTDRQRYRQTDIRNRQTNRQANCQIENRRMQHTNGKIGRNKKSALSVKTYAHTYIKIQTDG